MPKGLSALDKSGWGAGMRAMTMKDCEEVHYGALFAGMHIVEFVLQENAAEINDQMGTSFEWICKCASESDEETRHFIEKNGKVELLVEMTRELSQTQARDTRTKEFKPVSYMDNLFFGFSCTSKAPNNQNASENNGCVQDEKGQTGETFAETKLVVQRHRPRKLYGENLKSLDSTTPDHEFASDGDYIRAWFRDQGYWVDTFVVRAENYGSAAVRARWLLYGTRSDVK
jgi:site-specific DNA-cytosine methylase